VSKTLGMPVIIGGQSILMKSCISGVQIFDGGTMSCDTDQSGVLQLAAAITHDSVIDVFCCKQCTTDAQCFSVNWMIPKIGSDCFDQL